MYAISPVCVTISSVCSVISASIYATTGSKDQNVIVTLATLPSPLRPSHPTPPILFGQNLRRSYINPKSTTVRRFDTLLVSSIDLNIALPQAILRRQGQPCGCSCLAWSIGHRRVVSCRHFCSFHAAKSCCHDKRLFITSARRVQWNYSNQIGTNMVYRGNL